MVVTRWLRPFEAKGSRETTVASPLDVRAIYADYASFVWINLQRFGVRTADLEDAHQEVFVVVHRNIGTYDGACKLTTWLYGVALKVAAGYRRKAHVRREEIVDEVPEGDREGADDPEGAALAREARGALASVLDELDCDKRAVFVMFEIDEMPCDAIAEVLGVPVGTVYSRLHAARASFEAAAARHRARERSMERAR